MCGHSALRRVVGSDLPGFAAGCWGRRPLFSPAARLPLPFEDLFSPDAVDELVSRRGLRTPFLRVAKDGSTLGDGAFTSGGGIGALVADQLSDDKLLRLFADGATLVLQGLHRTWLPVTEFSQQLAADLGHPVQVNAYVTPPQSTGFSDHYDVHDVFVLQVAGEKQWRVRGPVLESPLRGQPWTARRDAIEAAAAREPLLELTMRPGDCLYLPRGYLHSATALGGVSVHLTVGVHTWTRYTVAEELAAAALAGLTTDPAVRASLPLGTDLCAADEVPDMDLVRAALHRAVDEVATGTLGAALAARARGAQRAAPLGPVRQLRAADELGGRSALRLRAHLAARLTEHEGYAVLDSRAGPLRLGAEEVTAVRRLLADGRAEVADLGPPLSRRLLLGGIVVPEQQ